MSKKTKSAAKSSKPAQATRSEKKSSMSNQTTWIIIIVAVLVVVVLLSVLGRNRNNTQVVAPGPNQLAPIVSPLPSPLDTGYTNTVVTPVNDVNQSGTSQPGWNLNFNANTAFGLSINAGINDQGELYVRPQFNSSIRDLRNLRNNSNDATSSNQTSESGAN